MIGFPPEESFPDECVSLEFFRQRAISLHIRRYDLIHPEISGNKLFKLRYWLGLRKNNEAVLSFGGAYSNHLLALSAAGKEWGIKTIGIVRGQENRDNAWLRKMRENGMLLKFIAREAYRDKENESFLNLLSMQHGPCLIVPEGGAGQPGIQGAGDMVREHEPYDYIVLPGGTGTSAAGIAEKLKAGRTVILCFQVLKGEGILRNEVLRTGGIDLADYPNLIVNNAFHEGGYARLSSALMSFCRSWSRETGIPVDTVYGAKALNGLFTLAKQDYFPAGTRILYLHTGGNSPV